MINIKTRMQIINESFDSMNSNWECKNPNNLFFNNEEFFTKEDIYELLNEAKKINQKRSHIDYDIIDIFEELLED